MMSIFDVYILVKVFVFFVWQVIGLFVYFFVGLYFGMVFVKLEVVSWYCI